MRWISRSRDTVAAHDLDAFWEQKSKELNDGVFWADMLKELKDRPLDRLELAMENLPLPAAFSEIAKALRTLIREAKKAGRSFDEELKLLYEFAVIDSYGLPYSEVLREPGYNVLEAIPARRFSHSHTPTDRLATNT